MSHRAIRLKLDGKVVVDETTLKALLEHLPVYWWEADGQLRVIDSGGGAFIDSRTPQRFLEAMRQDFAASWHSPKSVTGRRGSTGGSSM